ncbi:MAG: hypothetical protein D6811_05055, partial [Alphaproteobacteria bacterium]
MPGPAAPLSSDAPPPPAAAAVPHVLLARRPHRPGPAVAFLPGLALACGRAHELCGPARRTLALMVAAALDGAVMWIRPAWMRETLNPAGMEGLVNPGRLITVAAPRAEDLPWCAEEVLRAGVVALCVVELPAPPALTAVRRLHLAAETGAREGRCVPLGLVLTPGEGGAAGVESRWHMAAAHRPGETRWRLSRRRARTAPPAQWWLVRRGRRLVPLPA